MCLILSASKRNGKPEVADTDIVVYKVVIDNNLKQSNFFKKGILTLFMEQRITIGSTYKSRFSFDSDGDIERGLHSFANLKDANAMSKNFSNRKVVKCLIPAGSGYYKGWFDGVVSYASNKLTYLEFV